MRQCGKCGGIKNADPVLGEIRCQCDQAELAVPAGSPLPWKLHRTGSSLGIKSADRRFVINKVVSQLSMEDYARLLADFNTILTAVNAALCGGEKGTNEKH